jgi:hypothetical protein
MTKGDHIVESGSDRIQHLAEKASAHGGMAAKLADPLAEDAAFLRKMKPSLVKARIRGKRVPEESPRPVMSPPRSASADGGPNPIVVVGAAGAAGLFLAKLLDWRGHAHPRD